MDWQILERRPKQHALLKCKACGTERDAVVWNAKNGKVRCWTCRPDTRLESGVPTLTPPRYAASAADLTPLAGRIPTSRTGYARAVRYSIDPADDPAAEVQTGRVEICGIRTKNPLNRRLHWTAVSAAAKHAHKATLEALYASLGAPPVEGHPFSYAVRIARLSTKGLQDDEGVVASMKAVRDAFALFVGLSDGDRLRFRASYATGKAKVLAVVIEWTRTVGAFPDDGTEELIFFDEHEQRTLREEHGVTRRYWLARRKPSKAAKEAADIALAIGSLDEGGAGDDEAG